MSTDVSLARRCRDQEIAIAQLMSEAPTRWGVNRTGGTHVWFEVDAVGETD